MICKQINLCGINFDLQSKIKPLTLIWATVLFVQLDPQKKMSEKSVV